MSLDAFGLKSAEPPIRGDTWRQERGLFRGWVLHGKSLFQGPRCLGCGSMVASSYQTRADFDGIQHGGVPPKHHCEDQGLGKDLRKAMLDDAAGRRHAKTYAECLAWAKAHPKGAVIHDDQDDEEGDKDEESDA
jgi:hypothetical protein